MRGPAPPRSIPTVFTNCPQAVDAAIVLSHVHLGVAILLAAVCGGLITVLVGIARMFRLRRGAKKESQGAHLTALVAA